jgi:triphosphoribosyl-dephospho-CoA synthase
MSPAQRQTLGRQAFLWACGLDVAVRKPGNVSRASPGHGMQAAQFLRSAEVAAGPLFAAGQPVGARIEAAVVATRLAVGCNTNLGILLLCAPLAVAFERLAGDDGPQALAVACRDVLGGLDVDDARAAYRAIALANPGGLGRSDAQDVAQAPSIDLRAAMTLAAERDSIARQYANGYADIFGCGLPALADDGRTLGGAVQAVFLAFLAGWPDSHIVRKLDSAAAQTVTAEARLWRDRLRAAPAVADGAAFAAWDEGLKALAINPGTSADLTVCSLFAAALSNPKMIGTAATQPWHGMCIQSGDIGLFPTSDQEGAHPHGQLRSTSKES